VERFLELGRRGALSPPPPGQGDTAARWGDLAAWGREDLALGRLAEGHTDALAILAEVGHEPVPGALYGVWAARSGGTGARLERVAGRHVARGTVRFCSGASCLDRTLVVAAAPTGSRILDLPLDAPGLHPVPGSWTPFGMRASDSPDVELRDVPAPPESWVGEPDCYTGRAGFWWGGAGVAAVWLGGAAGVLDEVYAALPGGCSGGADPHQQALVGALHAQLAAADALLARTAEEIDADPKDGHRTSAWTARAAVERCCRSVLDAVPRLVGVAALTRGDGLERRLADLGVYVRQHHGERDLAALGAAVLEQRR
jgi:alkylation response protein AidB-like acyl-CoA dehydrogenase